MQTVIWRCCGPSPVCRGQHGPGSEPDLWPLKPTLYEGDGGPEVFIITGSPLAALEAPLCAGLHHGPGAAQESRAPAARENPQYLPTFNSRTDKFWPFIPTPVSQEGERSGVGAGR